MELDEELARANRRTEQAFQNLIFGALDVQLKNINRFVTEFLHDCREAFHGEGYRPGVRGALFQHGVRDVVWIFRRIKCRIAVNCGKTVLVQDKLFRKPLFFDPRNGSRSWIERVNGHAKSLDQLQIECSVLSTPNE